MPEHYRTAVLTAVYTDLRAGELWPLRREDVDLLRGELAVDEALKDINTTSEALAADEKGLLFGPTKTDATRAVSLPRFLRDVLTEHLSRPLPGGNEPRALVFTTAKGLPVRHGLFYSRVFKPAVVAALPEHGDYANQRGLRFHDLRHTCATLLVAQGAHALAVKQQLGHEDIRTTMTIYGHLFPSGLEALAAGLDAGYRSAEQDNVASIAR